MKRFLFALVVPFVALAAPQALSQNTQAALEEVIVTATKREESVQDIPIAVTAFDAVTLDRAGIKDLRDLSTVAASFNMNSTQTESQGTTLRMRGVGTTGNNIGLESSVGIFLDGVYLSRPGVALGDLLDVQQIEVLRGPQGTLFGRNTSAGAINILTKKPNLDEYKSFINLSAGNEDFRNIQAGSSGPLIEGVLAYRLSGALRQQDGFLKSTSGAESRNRDRYMLRGQLLWDINETMELRLIGDYSDTDEKCCDAVILSTGPGPGSFQAAGLPPHGGVTASGRSALNDITGNAEQFENPTEQYGISAEFNWDASDTTRLTFINSYRDFDAGSVQHSDFVGLDVFSVQPSAAGGQKSFDTIETWTSELRLAGEAGRLSWMVGAYYSDEQIEEGQGLGAGANYSAYTDANLWFFALQPALTPDAQRLLAGIPLATGGTFGDVLATLKNPEASPTVAFAGGVNVNGSFAQNNFKQDGTAWSIFTHNTLHVTDQLDLVLGLRWINEKKDGSFEQPLTNNSACLNTLGNAGALSAATARGAAYRTGTEAFVNAAVIAGARTAGAAGAKAAGAGVAGQAAAGEAAATAPATLVLAAATAAGAGAGLAEAASAIGNASAVYACFPFIAPALGIAFLPLPFDRTYRDDELAYTAKAVYAFTDSLTAYISFTHGYKAGGFNLDAGAAAQGADPRFAAETNDAWEFGIKSQWFDNRLRANLAVFDYDLEDFQVLDFTGVRFNTFNVPNAESQGLELELSALPAEGLNLSLAYTYADSSYPNDCDNNDPAASPRIQSLCGIDLTNAPKQVVTAGIGYEGNIMQNYVFFLNGFYRWEDDRRTGTQPGAFDIQKSNAKLNLRAGFGCQAGDWTLEIWGNNVTDERTKNVTFNTPLRVTSRAVFVEAPRTYGLTLRTNF